LVDGTPKGSIMIRSLIFANSPIFGLLYISYL